MKIFTSYIFLVSAAIIAFATTVSADPAIHFESCRHENDVACTVHEVRVRPCREAALSGSRPCSIKKGRTASISFDYTPNFSGDNLQSRAYWPNESQDLPFVGMSSDACQSTVCPAVAGTRQTYNYTLPISKLYRARTYKVKWKLWNEELKQCCFQFNIQLKPADDD